MSKITSIKDFIHVLGMHVMVIPVTNAGKTPSLIEAKIVGVDLHEEKVGWLDATDLNRPVTYWQKFKGKDGEYYFDDTICTEIGWNIGQMPMEFADEHIVRLTKQNPDQKWEKSFVKYLEDNNPKYLSGPVKLHRNNCWVVRTK